MLTDMRQSWREAGHLTVIRAYYLHISAEPKSDDQSRFSSLRGRDET